MHHFQKGEYLSIFMYNYREPETHYNIVILKQCECGRIRQGILPFKVVHTKSASHVGMCNLIKNCAIQSAVFFHSNVTSFVTKKENTIN